MTIRARRCKRLKPRRAALQPIVCESGLDEALDTLADLESRPELNRDEHEYRDALAALVAEYRTEARTG